MCHPTAFPFYSEQNSTLPHILTSPSKAFTQQATQRGFEAGASGLMLLNTPSSCSLWSHLLALSTSQEVLHTSQAQPIKIKVFSPGCGAGNHLLLSCSWQGSSCGFWHRNHFKQLKRSGAAATASLGHIPACCWERSVGFLGFPVSFSPKPFDS